MTRDIHIVSIIAAIVLFAALLAPTLVRAQDVAAYLAEGDNLAEKLYNNSGALNAYRKAEALEPNNYTVLWRISRAYVDIAEHMPAASDNQKDEQLAVYTKALDYANKAVKANPSGMMGYLRRAIANGRVALFKGVFSVVGLVKDVRTDLEKAIALNNEDKHHAGIAHYVLGRTHAKVCEKPYLVRLPLGLGWGDRDVAAREFETAIRLSPNFIMFRLDAARNYVELEEYGKARAHLAAIATLQLRDEDDQHFKKEASALLNSIANED